MERSDGGHGNRRIDRPLSGHQACEEIPQPDAHEADALHSAGALEDPDRGADVIAPTAISIARLMLAVRATSLFDPQTPSRGQS
jgi:hypothetical protein